MASIRPFFITGATAKIKLNNKTLAFCTNISYDVNVITQTPKILGMYEGSSVEPLGYSVSGSFTLIRYAKGVQSLTPGNKPDGVARNDAGNGVGNWGGVWGNGFANILKRNGIGNDGRANEALDPSKFALGTTFDIEIYQKIQTEIVIPPVIPDPLNANQIQANRLILNTVNLNLPQATKQIVIKDIGVAKIRNARITFAGFRMNKKSAAQQTFNFVALYADEDSFVADMSGLGQQY